MKKRGRTYKIFRAVGFAIIIPIIFLWILTAMLYIPSLQRAAVEKICREVSQATGFDIKIESFHLAFPLKASITGFEVSRNDTTFAKGEFAGVNISLMPLLSGEVEVNYISLEKVDLNTADLIPEVNIEGGIGFFRTTARNISLKKEIANLRQVHIHSTDLNITLNGFADTEEDSTTINWIANLHRGNIENCNITLNIPEEKMSVSTDIDKLIIREGTIDLGNEIYGISTLALKSSSLKYDAGNGNKKNEPLSHLEFDNINIECRNIGYTPDSSKLELNRFTLVQPGGIKITDAYAKLFADKEMLNIEDFAINSKNGSFIGASAKAPWQAIHGDKGNMNAVLSLGIYKKDLSALLTQEQLNALEIFDNEMFKGRFAVNGNAGYMNIDTIDIDIPTIANLQANGHVKNLNDIDKLEASIDLGCVTDDIKKIIGQEANDSTPKAIIHADGNIKYATNGITTDLDIKGLNGKIKAKASYDIHNNIYETGVEIKDIDITTLLSDLPLNHFTGKIKADGKGFDIFDEQTMYNIEAYIDSIVYDSINLNYITIDANQHNSLSKINLTSNSEYLKFNINADTELKKNFIDNKTAIEISQANLMMLGISDAEFGTKFKMDLEASTDMKESHAFKFNGKEMEITTSKKSFTPAEISFDFATTPDSSYITAKNGDLRIQGEMKSGYNGLFKSIDKIKYMLKEALKEENTLYYIQDYAKEIPSIFLWLRCGKNNILHNFLSINDISINNINLSMEIDAKKDININSGIYGFKTEELNLDTIRFFTSQKGNKIRYLAGVRSTAVNPLQQKLSFSSMLYGNIFNDSVTTNFMFRDRKDGVGIKLGLKTLFKPKELDISFRPDAVFLNNKFNFNNDNYIKLGSNGTVTADVTLSNETDAGMHLYTTPDKNAKLNANLELFNINLKELTGIIPFIPDISGMMNLELYFKKSKDDAILSSDIRIDDVAYEGTTIGDETIEIVYFPKDNEKHYLDILLSHNDEEVVHLNGDYISGNEEPELNGEISLNRFPLGITHIFTKDAGMSLKGYVNSEVKAVGRLSELRTDGFIQFDSVYLNAPIFGTDLRFSNKNVNIKNNKISFNNFDIYAKGDSPFNLNGTVDLSKLANPTFNLRMNASNYELINAPRTKTSMLYGKMFIDFRAFIAGALNNIKVSGNATLLGKSNITYVMQDAPIKTDKELDGLVEFVNFEDTTKIKRGEEEADLGNMNINLGLKIEDGARINADLDANRSSYIMLRGGGDLNMTYTGDNGLNVTGTYTMNDGELKYELPIIPLKTFNILDGSKVTWSGDLLDPSLEITAIERITTSVNIDDSGTQPVAFDVGVKISNTLSDMGLTFTISAPENAIVQDQLNSLDAETLNKYAVTMLITGTYIGNTKGMSVSNALSSFLDAKINDLAGTAMKSVSINVGINDAENAETGSTYKNYSFSFKKRFWNDRLTIVIGGEVNSGDNPVANDSFINNVSLEWKISDSDNRYLRLFYDKNYESLLEGEIIETGIGYVYKKKLQNLRELFIFKKNDRTSQKHKTDKGKKEYKKEYKQRKGDVK